MPPNYLSIRRVFDSPSDDLKKFGPLFGYAAILMKSSRTHRQHTMEYLERIIEPALKHEFIRFYFSEDGEVVGYIVWALLAPDVEQRIRNSGKFLLHESEWNEGENPWIVDMLFPYGNFKYAIADLRDNLFKNYSSVQYLKHKKEEFLNRKIYRDGANRLRLGTQYNSNVF